ncbi:hypothetical protein FRC18_007635 [Serendipita sp. 400]|nr:hypothetical protein FRC18_007635 [Serendipita sp. 400]
MPSRHTSQRQITIQLLLKSSIELERSNLREVQAHRRLAPSPNRAVPISKTLAVREASLSSVHTNEVKRCLIDYQHRLSTANIRLLESLPKSDPSSIRPQI